MHFITTGFQACMFGYVTTFLLNECMMNRIRGKGLHRHLHVTDENVQNEIHVVYLSMRLFKRIWDSEYCYSLVI